jgi:hypothetical protein
MSVFVPIPCCFYCYGSVNGKMIPFETLPGIGGGGYKREW